MRDIINKCLNNLPRNIIKYKNGLLFCCEAIDFLESVKSEIADIIFIDPPFNLGKEYGSRSKKDDHVEESDYIYFINNVIDNSIRILKPGGALYFYHIPKWALVFGAYMQDKILFRHWIAVSMKNGFVRGKYLYPAHYALLYFTKGNPDIFQRPKISPSTCRHCGKLVKDYGGYKKYIKDGINLSDFWEDLSPVRHNKYKSRSSNELPLELLRRVVTISGKKKGILVDPFVGSGTSLIAAVEHDMNFIACDREESYCQVTHQRLSKLGKSRDHTNFSG